jgi:hypothetical protein
MKLKWLLSILFVAFLLAITPQKAEACEIEFEILKGKKEIYNPGDKLIVKVHVALTHRSCPVAIKKTQFKLNGIKVIGATKWKQLSSMDFERKLKIVITEKTKNEAIINAIRECDKDGGFGSLKLDINTTK